MSDSQQVLSLLSDDLYLALADNEGIQMAQAVHYLNLCQTLVEGQYMTQEQIADSMGMSYNTLLKRRHEWKESGDLERAQKVFNEVYLQSTIVAQMRVAGRWGEILERILDKALTENNLRDLLPLLKFLKEEAITPLLTNVPSDERDESDYLRQMREAQLKAAKDALDSGTK